MAAAHRMKAADKQEICKKALTLWKKTYANVSPKSELPVLETMLYACCLENATQEEGEQAYARVLNNFHDLNEVRVSSIYELERVFTGMSDPEWRALRIKNILQHVFESTYTFDLETLRRKSADLAVKQLSKIPSLSPFVRAYAMQHALASHALPVDDRMAAALVWMGLVEPGHSSEDAGESLRPFVRKADGQQFCFLLRCFATDPRFQAAFEAGLAENGAPVSFNAHRIEELVRTGGVPKPAKKTAAAKKAARPSAPEPAEKPKVKRPAKTSARSPSKKPK